MFSLRLHPLIKLVFFIFLTLNFACKQEEKSISAEEDEKEDTLALSQDLGQELIITSDRVYLREEAGVDGKIIQALARGETVYESGEVSSYLTQIRLKGQQYNAPWIKVVTKEGKNGWIFASPALMNAGQNNEIFFWEKNFEATFGQDIFNHYKLYRLQKDSIQDAKGFLKAFQSMQWLKSKVKTAMDRNEKTELQQIFWLVDLFPDWIPQLDPADQSFDLYIDFKAWLADAQGTEDKADDEFLNVCFRAYPEDSIEYQFPAWFIQTSLDNGHSLLGRGIHLEMFEKINNLIIIDETFKEELMKFKIALIEDIVLINSSYWEEKKLAKNELKTILDRKFAFFDASDQLALQNRLKDFDKAEKLGIQFNYKSGIYE